MEHLESLHLNDELDIREAPYPVKYRLETDKLCRNTFKFIFILVLLFFIGIIYFGAGLSLFHPIDEHGQHCGVNNKLYDTNLTNHAMNPLLTIDSGTGVRLCSNKCNGDIIMFRCVSRSISSLRKAPLSYQLLRDFLNYKKFAIILIGIILISSIPLSILSARF